ncbi:MAG: DNA-processing protein DprA [Actinobacteria bacterium]|nr:DNA-processing protein DprA [Actinomycetota bacterium]
MGASEDRATYEAALGLAWLSQFGCSPLLRLMPQHGLKAVWKASEKTLCDQWKLAPAVAARLQEKRTAFSPAAMRDLLKQSGLIFIPFGAPNFPAELVQLSYPPAGLFVKGEVDKLDHLLRLPRVTLVGTRKSSPYGNRVVDLVACAFVGGGVAVVSGLALGIDGRAHEAALDAGGMTAAVLGCGADIVYPPSHQRLYEKVAARGLIISEFPPGTRPDRWTFPHRNRLLAALGDAVVVVEGSQVSGALQTAAAAVELGRSVFAVPGPITCESHEGCNRLIYDGALPVIDPFVAVEEFLLRTRIERGDRLPAAEKCAGVGPDAPAGGTSPYDAPVLEALDSGACTIDCLISRTGLNARQIAVSLTELEVGGLVVRAGGGLYIRAP